MRVFCGGFRYQGEIDDRSRLLRKAFHIEYFANNLRQRRKPNSI